MADECSSMLGAALGLGVYEKISPLRNHGGCRRRAGVGEELQNRGHPGTHYVDQAVLELKEIILPLHPQHWN